MRRPPMTRQGLPERIQAAFRGLSSRWDARSPAVLEDRADPGARPGSTRRRRARIVVSGSPAARRSAEAQAFEDRRVRLKRDSAAVLMVISAAVLVLAVAMPRSGPRGEVLSEVDEPPVVSSEPPASDPSVIAASAPASDASPSPDQPSGPVPTAAAATATPADDPCRAPAVGPRECATDDDATGRDHPEAGHTQAVLGADTPAEPHSEPHAEPHAEPDTRSIGGSDTVAQRGTAQPATEPTTESGATEPVAVLRGAGRDLCYTPGALSGRP